MVVSDQASADAKSLSIWVKSGSWVPNSSRALLAPCTTPLANSSVNVAGSMVGISSAGVGSPNGMERS